MTTRQVWLSVAAMLSGVAVVAALFYFADDTVMVCCGCGCGCGDSAGRSTGGYRVQSFWPPDCQRTCEHVCAAESKSTPMTVSKIRDGWCGIPFW